MKISKTAALIALLAIITLTAFCSTTYAITGNSQPDSTPYVGVVVLFSDPAMTHPISISSGFLISPTIVLTAGHSVIGGVAACVCFDQGPITYSIDETGKIHYNTNQPIYSGVPIPFPTYLASIVAGAKDSKLLQTSDVGIITLNTPVQEVKRYPALSTPGLADTLPVKTALQVIGYGVQNPSKGHDLFPISGSISRNSATVNLLSTNFQGSGNYIKCTANAAQAKVELRTATQVDQCYTTTAKPPFWL
jgi:hypothetical protein